MTEPEKDLDPKNAPFIFIDIIYALLLEVGRTYLKFVITAALGNPVVPLV